MVKIQNITFLIFLFANINFSSLSEYYPTQASFKYCILPYLSTKDIIQYYQAQKSTRYPVNFEKLLEQFDQNIILNYSDLSEKIKIFFRTPVNEDGTPKFPFKSDIGILYDLQTKEAFLGDQIENNIPRDCFCLNFKNRVFPIKKVASQTGNTFWISFWKVENTILSKFCIFDEQSKSEISCGPIPRKLSVAYEHYILRARKLSAVKKVLLNIRHFLNKLYLHYLKFFSSICSGTLAQPQTRQECVSVFFRAFIRTEFKVFPLSFLVFLFLVGNHRHIQKNFNFFGKFCIHTVMTFVLSIFRPKLEDYWYNFAVCEGETLNSFKIEPKMKMTAASFLRKKTETSYVESLTELLRPEWEMSLHLLLKICFCMFIDVRKMINSFSNT